jgi:hypothetical protein
LFSFQELIGCQMSYHDGFMFEERIITNLNIFLERVVCLGPAVVFDTLMRIISGDSGFI